METETSILQGFAGLLSVPLPAGASVSILTEYAQNALQGLEHCADAMPYYLI